MTGIQLEDVLKLSIGIEIFEMYFRNYDLLPEKAHEIVLDFYSGTCNFLDKMEKVQEIFYRYRLAEKDDMQDLNKVKEDIKRLEKADSSITCSEFLQAVRKLIAKTTMVQREMCPIVRNAWKQWDEYVNTPLLKSARNAEITGEWSLTGCAIDGINLDYITRVAQGNISCSLITEKTQRLYNNRQLALLYKCDTYNTFAMCNGDLNTGLGSINHCGDYQKIFDKFYKDFYQTAYVTVASMPEFCNPGSKVFYDVLPLELMRNSITENTDCNVQNEIVINGRTSPYGLLCYTDSLEYAKRVHCNFAALGWELLLVELTKEHKLIRHD